MSDAGAKSRGYREFPHSDLAVCELAAESWGIVSTAELLARGISRDGISRRVGSGRLHRLHRGAYCVGHANPPWQGRLLAAVKACGPDGVASHFSAAALWGLLDYDADRYPDVLVAGRGAGRRPGIRTHRTTELIARDRARCQGVPATAVPRTLLDLASLTDEKTLRSLVRRAQGLNLIALRHLTEVLARGRARPGTAVLGRVIAAGPAPTKNEFEDAVLDLLLAGGFEHPDVNKALVVAGRKVFPDFRWPARRLIVEADSRAWHENEVAREDDAERQALLEAAGERVIRVTWRQAVTRSTETLARVAAAGAPRTSTV